MKKIVVLTGAGISAESGIQTFRDKGGFWEQYDLNEVATHDAYLDHPSEMLDFYNMLRNEISKVSPNEAHKQLVRLEEKYDVTIVTQNVDNLHELAGSSKVLHLHGDITKARSDFDDKNIVDIGYNDIHMGDKAPDGTQLRPHIVWFGEAVFNMEEASELCFDSDYFIVIGSSLNVYPAAGLINMTGDNTKCYYIDPKPVPVWGKEVTEIKEVASVGVKMLVDELLNIKDNE